MKRDVLFLLHLHYQVDGAVSLQEKEYNAAIEYILKEVLEGGQFLFCSLTE
jgi:hypothetical protein